MINNNTRTMDNTHDKFDALWAQFKDQVRDARTAIAADKLPTSVNGDNAFSSAYAYVGKPYRDRTASLNVCATGCAQIGADLQPEALVTIAAQCMVAAQVIMERRQATTDAQDAH